MTDLEIAYFNYEHVLSAYLPCLFLAEVGRRRDVGRLSCPVLPFMLMTLLASGGWEPRDCRPVGLTAGAKVPEDPEISCFGCEHGHFGYPGCPVPGRGAS